MKKLEGKIVVITGGAQGIGAAVAKRCAHEGAIVAIGDMNNSAGIVTFNNILQSLPKGSRGGALFKPLDVTDTQSIEQFVTAMMNTFGHIDVLVNNAGITRDTTLLKMTDEDFDAVVNVNLRGVFKMTRAVAPHMVAQGSGVILNASSVVANGNFGQTNYAATKAGVEAMTVTWARELGKKGIRVNAVAPGFTETSMTASLPLQAKDRVIATTPLARFATPEEIAAMYSFLASDDASFITGQIMKVDGGLII